jgi:aminopeptidase P (EC:3.4.11.9). Metallo peptidase. MEROPS family M24B
MQQMGPGNIALIASASSQVRNRDVEFPFRQDSDFYYLTGFDEADALAVFIPGREQGEYILFVRNLMQKKPSGKVRMQDLKGQSQTMQQMMLSRLMIWGIFYQVC